MVEEVGTDIKCEKIQSNSRSIMWLRKLGYEKVSEIWGLWTWCKNSWLSFSGKFDLASKKRYSWKHINLSTIRFHFHFSHSSLLWSGSRSHSSSFGANSNCFLGYTSHTNFESKWGSSVYCSLNLTIRNEWSASNYLLVNFCNDPVDSGRSIDCCAGLNLVKEQGMKAEDYGFITLPLQNLF